LFSLFAINAASAQTDYPGNQIELYIALSGTTCELLEPGTLATPGQAPERPKLRFQGKASQYFPQVITCEVDVEGHPINQVIQQCMLSGFQHASTYFFKGELNSIQRSCGAGRLRSGAYHFNMQGISSDICRWTCTLKPQTQ